MSMKDMKEHLRANADCSGNLWYQCEGGARTYTPFRINIWGLCNTDCNKEDSKDVVQQQVTNILRHLQIVQKEHVMEDVLPKGTPLPPIPR